MAGTAGERLAETLGSLEELPAFSVYRKLFMSDLSVTVEGVGPLKFPVSAEQAAQLRDLGRRARFGHREETLTDPRVRDTWEIPKDLVHVEWTESFRAVLELMREEMGLPPNCELVPDLHSMLLYETGQFFLSHQDSEKDDSMIGTLVAALPSAHTGGELVIEHLGQTAEYRGSAVAVSLVAFYADCRHQVLPVKSGNRITLTYNLLVKGERGMAAEEALADELAACLNDHFTTPVIARYGRRQADPPIRLAYLLDHEYTSRGLSWSRLKGADADRAALLRAAADRVDCEVALALAEIQETWDAYPSDEADSWNDYDYYEEEDEDGGENEDASADDGQYVLQDLIDSSVTLGHWLGPQSDRPEEITLTIDDEEVAATTPSTNLRPYSSEYEGYMGNYGNTLDRWYRRAAVVIWRRDQGFANRAQASPAWALDELGRVAHAQGVAAARDAAQSLAPFWEAHARSGPPGELLTKALRTARAVQDAETAAMLLRPFQFEQLSPGDAPSLAGLAAQHGDAWTADLLRGWSKTWRRGSFGYSQDLPQWFAGLPRLCAALTATGSAGTTTAHHILDLSWEWLAGTVRPWITGPTTSRKQAWLAGLGRPLADLLMAADQAGAADVLDMATIELRQADGDQAIVLIMAALRVVGPHPKEGRQTLGKLAAHSAERIRGLLTRPQREPDDWSIKPPAGCTCDLCQTLDEFLQDTRRRTFEWPIAQAKRAHVHSRIDRAELPVSHQTRREGRPYTLVLTKTDALLDMERSTRERNQADLDWLARTWNATR